MNPYDVFKKIRATEKSSKMASIKRQSEDRQKLVFEVNSDANKSEIKRAFELAFGKKPLSVNTVTLPGKWKRRGSKYGRTSGVKKAIITLKAADKLEITSTEQA
jgi:large subunit ribosomal protein L23